MMMFTLGLFAGLGLWLLAAVTRPWRVNRAQDKLLDYINAGGDLRDLL
jgi:hypothetical protein